MFFDFVILPPHRTPHCTDVFQCRQYRIWACVTCRPHGSPHAFGIHLRQERGASCFPNHSCCPRCPRAISWQCLFFFSFESEQTHHSLCLPTFHSAEDGFTPGPVFAPEAKYTADLLHHSFANHSPWYVFQCICRSSHLSTRPCSHSASFPPRCSASFQLDGKYFLGSGTSSRAAVCVALLLS